MDAEIKRKWIEALRGGQYQQATLALRRNNVAFCCLGVLCDVTQPQEWACSAAGDWYHRDCDGTIDDDLAGEEFGLTFEQQETLASLNDSGKTFGEIANYIEKHL